MDFEGAGEGLEVGRMGSGLEVGEEVVVELGSGLEVGWMGWEVEWR